MTRFILVSGLPASGKTTLAAALARALALPLFDKDAFLESLFAERPPSTPAERAELSRLADLALQQAVERSNGAVVASWWRHPRAGGESGTPVAWLERVSSQWVEVYCRCPPHVAVGRFLGRTRHPGHFDRRSSYDELLERFEKSTRLGPLGVGQLVEVDTSEIVDIDALAERVLRLD
jgi:shikimate kinase